MCLWLLAILAVCLTPFGVSAGELRYVGSSTVGGFIADAAQVYNGSTFDIHTKPESLGGERCPRLGTCDLGGVARELSVSARNNGVVGTLIGRDAIAVIVHPDNPVRELTAAQIKGVFTGTVRNWAELGGLKIPVSPHIVDWNSATRQVFQQAMLGESEYAGCTVAAPDTKVLQEVARNIGAIGHISSSLVTRFPGVRALPIDGHAPAADNTGYPIRRPLFLTTNGPPRGEVAAFIRWTLSPQGQSVVRRRFAGAP